MKGSGFRCGQLKSALILFKVEDVLRETSTPNPTWKESFMFPIKQIPAGRRHGRAVDLRQKVQQLVVRLVQQVAKFGQVAVRCGGGWTGYAAGVQQVLRSVSMRRETSSCRLRRAAGGGTRDCPDEG
uniref:C2 domain-containing protein n=1 Tax=Macrostomum lignano TaxID=282301 RepID=A0A1I8FLR9_9PLAT